MEFLVAGGSLATFLGLVKAFLVMVDTRAEKIATRRIKDLMGPLEAKVAAMESRAKAQDEAISRKNAAIGECIKATAEALEQKTHEEMRSKFLGVHGLLLEAMKG